MKKVIWISLVLVLAILATAVVFYFIGLRSSTRQGGVGSQNENTALINQVIQETGEVWSSLEAYQPLNVIERISITPDSSTTTGAFCRWYYDEDKEQFFSTFGTGHSQGVGEGYIGGGEGGQGAKYKYFSLDLESTGESAYYIYGGGDLASVLAEGFYYHLSGSPVGWRLSKYNVDTWELVKQVDISLNENEGANDQMLAYVNGMLIASSVYGDKAKGADTAEDKKQDPTVGVNTHHHAYTLDLEPIDSWIFDDRLHANGSSMVFVDGIYQFVTTTAYFGDMIVMQYDQDWNYLGYKTLIEDAQWPQGTVYDPQTEQYYVAYLSTQDPSRSEVNLAVFDSGWNLVSNTLVTDYGEAYSGGRPSVLLKDGKVYVTSDKESRNTSTKSLNKDWQCELSVYAAE